MKRLKDRIKRRIHNRDCRKLYRENHLIKGAKSKPEECLTNRVNRIINQILVVANDCAIRILEEAKIFAEEYISYYKSERLKVRTGMTLAEQRRLSGMQHKQEKSNYV